MRTRKTIIAIQNLIDQLQEAQRLHSKIVGQVKQLPKGWTKRAEECSPAFYVLCESHFSPTLLDKITLDDFINQARSIYGYKGGPLL